MKKNSKTYDISMGDIKGNSTYDAARANWGGSWRLPTRAEFQELIDNCNSEWTIVSGIKGRRFTSKRNGKSIFLPSAGWRFWSSGRAAEYCCYWSSTPHEGSTDYAYHLYFDSDNCYTHWNFRYLGRSVRPVSD